MGGFARRRKLPLCARPLSKRQPSAFPAAQSGPAITPARTREGRSERDQAVAITLVPRRRICRRRELMANANDIGSSNSGIGPNMMSGANNNLVQNGQVCYSAGTS